jgi:hypothetical protein
MRRLSRAWSPRKFEQAREGGRTITKKRIEQSHLDVRLGDQCSDLSIAPGCVEAIEQNAHTNATLSRIHEAFRQQARSLAIAHDVILQIKGTVSRIRQRGPRQERLGAEIEDVKSGVSRMRQDVWRERATKRGSLGILEGLGRSSRDIQTHCHAACE